jgi:hypothetical protein
MSAARQPHHAPGLMHAHVGGQASTTLTVTKAARDLHIDARILAQPGLSLTACALLAEVLDLYRVKGQVFADNAHFEARCRCSERTVRNTIAELEEAGYLEREVDQKRNNKRLLVPTDKWQNVPEAPAEFAGGIADSPANSAASSGKNYRNPRQNLPQAPAEFAAINTNINTKGNTNSNTTPAAACAEKNEEAISAENPGDASHTEGGETDVATSKSVGPRGWAYDPTAIDNNLLLPFESSEFRAAWVLYRTYREEQGYRRLNGGLHEQEVLRKLGVLAAGDQQLALDIISQTIEKGWQGLFKLDQSHATARKLSANNRPAAGAGRVETLPTYGRNRGPQAGPASGAA